MGTEREVVPKETESCLVTDGNAALKYRLQHHLPHQPCRLGKGSLAEITEKTDPQWRLKSVI